MALNPKRGQVWYVNLDPTVGAEIQKRRPCVVISSDTAGILPLRLVVPITGWQRAFDNSFWMVRLEPEAGNGLTKPSTADTLQTRSVSLFRFVGPGPAGALSDQVMQSITEALLLTVDYEPPLPLLPAALTDEPPA